MAPMNNDDVLQVLRDINEPELGINIVGLSYMNRVTCSSERVDISVTLTKPSCPLGGLPRLVDIRAASDVLTIVALAGYPATVTAASWRKLLPKNFYIRENSSAAMTLPNFAQGAPDSTPIVEG
jgi:Iron-sulfur cluster assembly protein